MKICRDHEITNLISSKCREIEQYINNLFDEDVMSNQNEIITNNMYKLYRIEPIVIDEEVYKNRKINKAIIKQYNPFANTYPLTGDEIIFYYKGSTFGCSVNPEIELYGGYFTISKSMTLESTKKSGSKEKLEIEIKKTV